MILIAGKDMHHASESNGEPLLTWRMKIHWWSPRKRDAVTAGGSVGTWKAVGRRDRHLRRAALKNCEMPVAPWVAVGRPASRLSSWQTTDCPPAPSLIGLSRNHLRQAQQTDSCFCWRRHISFESFLSHILIEYMLCSKSFWAPIKVRKWRWPGYWWREAGMCGIGSWIDGIPSNFPVWLRAGLHQIQLTRSIITFVHNSQGSSLSERFGDIVVPKLVLGKLSKVLFHCLVVCHIKGVFMGDFIRMIDPKIIQTNFFFLHYNIDLVASQTWNGKSAAVYCQF